MEDLHHLLNRLDVQVAGFDQEHTSAAVQGWRRFGKGRHGAALNLGDCYSYGVTKYTATALIFKGDDFSQTDVSSAI